jgi:hypothetical protein
MLNSVQSTKLWTEYRNPVILSVMYNCPYRVLVAKPEERKQLGRHRHRWEDNIRMDLLEIRLGAWAELIWLRIGTSSWLL